MVSKESKKRTCITSPRFPSQPTPGKLKRHLGNKHCLLKHPPITLDYLPPFLHLCSQTLIVCADIHCNTQNAISFNIRNNDDLDSTAACFRSFLSHLCYLKVWMYHSTTNEVCKLLLTFTKARRQKNVFL